MEMTSGWAHGIRILIQELRSNMHHIKCTATGQQMNARF